MAGGFRQRWNSTGFRMEPEVSQLQRWRTRECPTGRQMEGQTQGGTDASSAAVCKGSQSCERAPALPSPVPPPRPAPTLHPKTDTRLFN